MIEYLITIVHVIIIYLVSIIFHEVGHAIAYTIHTNTVPVLMLDKVGRSYEVTLFDPSDPELKKLTNKQYVNIIAWGILAGAGTIIFLSLLFKDSFLFSLPILLIYLAGCRSDIKEVIRTYKEVGTI